MGDWDNLRKCARNLMFANNKDYSLSLKGPAYFKFHNLPLADDYRYIFLSKIIMETNPTLFSDIGIDEMDITRITINKNTISISYTSYGIGEHFDLPIEDGKAIKREIVDALCEKGFTFDYMKYIFDELCFVENMEEFNQIINR